MEDAFQANIMVDDFILKQNVIHLGYIPSIFNILTIEKFQKYCQKLNDQ